MIPIQYIYANRLIVIAAISGVSILIFSLFLYNSLHTDSFSTGLASQVVSTAPGYAYLSPQAATASASTTAIVDPTPIPNINIASDGLVLLNDAQVVSVSGSTIDVTVSFNGMTFPWIVQTNSSTKYPIAGGNFQTLADIQSGAIVTITGTLTGAGSEPSINATFVRE